MSKKDTVFIYNWFIDNKDEDTTKLRAYALDKNNKNICLHVSDFTPYVYIELPQNIEWTERKAQLLGNKLDEELGEHAPLKKCLIMKHKLYGAYINEKTGKRKLFPYLFCSFASRMHISRYLGPRLRRAINVQGVGYVKMKIHEGDADQILQLVSCRDIPSVGWVKFIGEELTEDEKITYCEHEYNVKWKGLYNADKNMVGHPLIMGFDIEVNSMNPAMMPKAKNPGDKVFQISCVFNREGTNENELYLLTLGQAKAEIIEIDAKVFSYDTEAELLKAFTQLVQEKNPNVICGYNILGFDIQYMIDRAKLNYCISDFDKLGFHKFNHSQEKKIKWSSSAFKTQEFDYLDAEGRIFVDLLPLIQRDYKFSNYKLGTVSQEILKDDKKDDLSIRKMFKYYRIGTKRKKDGTYSNKAIKAMSLIGRYCLKDSELCVKLMKKMDTWTGLTEFAKTVNTGIFGLYTQGQQIKVYSQVYKYCLQNNIVVEKDGYVTKEGERYAGAHVFPPVPGLYDRVLPFDFCLTGDTLVTLSNGTSKRIDSLNNDELVLGYNKEGFQNFSTINGLQKKGLKETIKIYLEDGKTITSTPDHKFMLENGEWCRADELKDKYVMAGIEYPEDIKCNLEHGWKLEVDDYTFTMELEEERNKSLIFARIIGYILSDGSIYKTGKYERKCSEAYFGTLIDAENFKNDIKKLSKIDFSIRKRETGDIERSKKGTTFSIALPSCISKMIHSLDDIIIRKRSTQSIKLPKFILEDNCPLSIIREFLGGLYGGDGTAPFICKRDTFGTISFKWTTIETHVDSLINVFNQIKDLQLKIGITSIIYKPILIQYENKKIIPCDIKENPRYDVQLSILLEDIYIFSQKIGFRYCINKTCKLHIASSYIGMRIKTREQHSFVVNKTNELIHENIKNVFSRKKNQPTFKSCLEIARNELIKNEPSINVYSLSSLYDIGYQRGEIVRHSDKPRKLTLNKKKFPSSKQYLLNTGTDNWFAKDNYKNVYAVKSDDLFIPSFKQKVIDIRPNGIQEVFDIEVNESHNFLANGIVTHNCSLYPTTMIAYNFDYSTLVPDDSNIPDSKCNVIKFSDHWSCEHDPKVIKVNEINKQIDKQNKYLKELRAERDKKCNKLSRDEFVKEIAKKLEELKPLKEERAKIKKTILKKSLCGERYYRFYKEEKGVVPTILQNLLDARKNTRVEIKKNKKEIEELMKNLTEENKIRINDLKILNGVLDKRQLAYKVSCNSAYGAYGVQKGYLPFMPGAMATTYMGRTNIEIVAKTIQEKYGGVLVYGDTDSNYITFPHITTAHESWNYAEKVAEEVSELFPKPISLAFEEAIYWQFLILSKKRYMYKSCGKDGVVNQKIGKKGVLLARRDNAVLVRTLYEQVIDKVFDKVNRDEVIYFILQEINKIFSHSVDYKNFVVTKAVGDTGGFSEKSKESQYVIPFKDEKGRIKGKIGTYTVPLLSENPKERESQLKKKNATTAKEFYEKCLPAQVVLAEKIKRRGGRVENGARLEYLIVESSEGHKGKQYEKIEDFDYFKLHSHIIKVDYFYYLEVMINPLDEVLNVVYGKHDPDYPYQFVKNFTQQQFDFRYKVREKVINELKSLFRPKLWFVV